MFTSQGFTKTTLNAVFKSFLYRLHLSHPLAGGEHALNAASSRKPAGLRGKKHPNKADTIACFKSFGGILRKSLFTGSIALFFSLPLHAADFCVSNPEELNSALTTAASNGETDTVMLVAGTYDGNFIYASTEAFNLTIQGGYSEACLSRSNDPLLTVLAAGMAGNGLALSGNQADIEYFVDGLTIIDALGSDDSTGGGLLVLAPRGSAHISNSIFHRNQAGSDSLRVASVGASGGGAYIEAINAIVEYSYFSHNKARGNGGGGLYVDARNADIHHNYFAFNESQSDFSSGGGGGLHLRRPQFNPILLTKFRAYNNIFEHNAVTSGEGAAVNVNQIRELELFNNVVANNTMESGRAGAVSIEQVMQAKVANNLIYNNIIRGNCRFSGGAGLIARAVLSLAITNNTITGNRYVLENSCEDTIDVAGIGIFVAQPENTTNPDISDPGLFIYNNIIWNNHIGLVTSGSGVDVLGKDLYLRIDSDGNQMSGTVEINNNNFDQSETGFYSDLPLTVADNNLDNVDPLFLDAANGVYKLHNTSPLINAGHVSPPGLVTGGDADSASRFVDIIDIGAFEFQADRDIKVVPPTMMFDDVQIGQSSNVELWVYNTGTEPLMVTGVDMTNFAAPYSIVNNGCDAATLQVNSGCSIEVEFAPEVESIFKSEFIIKSNDINGQNTTATFLGRGVPVPAAKQNGDSGGGGGGALSAPGLILLALFIVAGCLWRLGNCTT